MSIDVGKLEDHAIADCRTADDAQGVLWFYAAIRDILNAKCECETVKKENPATGKYDLPFTCWPCLLRAARDRED